MSTRLTRTTTFALYQLSLFAGVLLLPIALVARRMGIPVPYNRIIARLGDAVDAGESTE